MEYTEADYMGMLRDAFPRNFLRALLTSVVTAHRVAYREMRKQFDNPGSRHNLVGHVRKEKLNEEALALGERFKIKVEMRPYGRGSGYYVLISSRHIFLVICVSSSRRAMVRDADYRKALARLNENGQRRLAFMPQESQMQDGQYLCILIHGRQRGKDYPAFADIAFPHKSFRQWICRLNMFQEFPDLVEKLIIQHDTEARPKAIRTRREHTA
jgi:hypothetical protein